MNRQLVRLSSALAALSLSGAPAFAHHVMGGRIPATFIEGILSGLGHPIIGLDHFAAVVAVGCLAAAHRTGAVLAVGFVLAMVVGVALHLHGAMVPVAEVLVAVSVIALGAVMLRRREMSASAALALFVGVGLVHGYALGESIYGAEPAPLYAYLFGLAVIQTIVALGAMQITHRLVQRSGGPDFLRLTGAGIAGIGLAVLMQQVIPGA